GGSCARPRPRARRYCDVRRTVGRWMMAVMTAQPPLPLTLEGARPGGTGAAIVEDDAGGRVFVHGNLAYAWDVDDAAARRFAAVSLMRIKAATQLEVAEAF